jgi:hypothetical protein
LDQSKYGPLIGAALSASGKEGRMSNIVRFLGKSAITGAGGATGQQLWSYEVEGDPPFEIGTVLALGRAAASGDHPRRGRRVHGRFIAAALVPR